MKNPEMISKLGNKFWFRYNVDTNLIIDIDIFDKITENITYPISYQVFELVFELVFTQIDAELKSTFRKTK